MNQTIQISHFDGITDKYPKPAAITWEELVELFGEHEVLAQKDRGLLWSATEYYEGATRSKKGVAKMHALVVDVDLVDDEQVAQLLARCEGMRWLAYSSFSHDLWQKYGPLPSTQGGPGAVVSCFRMVFALSRPVENSEWERFWDRAIDWLTEGSAFSFVDRKCRDSSHFYFLPAKPTEDSASFSDHGDGEPIDVDATLARPAPKKAPPHKYEKPKKSKPAPGPDGTAPGVFSGLAEVSLAGAKVGEGGRNAALFKGCCALRKRIPSISEEDVRTWAHARNADRFDPPLEADEVDAIAQSAFRYEADYADTQDGNAQRFIDKHGIDFKWAATLWQKWLYWDGRRWTKQGAREAALYAARDVIVEDLAADQAKAAFEGETSEYAAKKAAKLAALIQKSQASAMYEGMLKIAAADPDICTSHDAFDQKPWLLACANGTLELRASSFELTLREPAREDMLIASTSIAYNEAADQTVWRKFIDDVTGGNVSLARYLQKAVGYSLTGDVSEHALFFLYGSGANGKSLFVNTVLRALGEYGHTAPAKLLTLRKGEAHPTAEASLYGARFVSVPEIEGGVGWDEDKMKMLTGGDAVSARRMHEDFWTFAPTHKFWVSGNHLPTVKESKAGIWRRMRVIPFDQSFLGREDHGLEARLRTPAVLEGVLAWAVQGCLMWQAEGLSQVPECILAATEEYRQEEDIVGQFLDERCDLTVGDDSVIKVSDLYAEYKRWAAIRGDERFVLGPKQFNRKIREAGPRSEKRGRDVDRVVCWIGIRLYGGIPGKFAGVSN